MELRPMVDIRLMETCPRCTMHTRCPRRARTSSGHHYLLNKSAGVLGLGHGVRSLCPSLTNCGEIDIHSEQLSVLHCQLYINSHIMSFSTSSLFMVHMSSPNLEATNTGGRRLRLCVANGTVSSAPRRRTSLASSVSGITTPRYS